MIPTGGKIIAVDFDGTIVEDRYPEIGKPQLFAFETLLKLQEEGHRLILWTYRVNDKLDAAVAFCREKGLEFYAVNESYPGENPTDPENSRKIHADLFIDDRNLGGLPDWGEIYHAVTGQIHQAEVPAKATKKRWKLF